MADQTLLLEYSEFFLDLHSTERAEARRIVRRRILECYRYGIQVLKVVYGSPESFAGSIAEAVFELLREDDLVALEMLPPYVFEANPHPDQISTSIRIFLRKNLNPEPITTDTQFAPFSPRYETEITKKLRCRTPFQPKRNEYSLDWLARAIGKGCSTGSLDPIYLKICPPNSRSDQRLTWNQVCQIATGYERSHKDEHNNVDAPPISDPLTGPRDVSAVEAPEPVPDQAIAAPEALLAKAEYLEEQSRYSEAEQVLLEMLTETTVHVPNHIEQATLMLGRVYCASHNPDAERILRRAYDLRKARKGERHPSMSPILTALFTYYGVSGEAERALELLKKLDEVAEELDDRPDSRRAISGTLLRARLQNESGNPRESLLALRAVSHFLEGGTLRPADDVFRFDLLALNYLDMGFVVEAEAALNTALRVSKHQSLPVSYRMRCLMHMGRLMRKAARAHEASEVYRKAIAELEEIDYDDEFLLAMMHSGLGVSLKYDGQESEAETQYRKALSLFGSAEMSDHPECAKSFVSLGTLLFETDRLEEAEHCAMEALLIFEVKTNLHYYNLATCCRLVSEISKKQGKLAQAKEFDDKAYGLLRERATQTVSASRD